MDIANFLARVVGPGAYAGIAFKNPQRGGMGHKFYPRDELPELARTAKWIADKGSDMWFACASFNASIAPKIGEKGKPTDDGVRTAENVETLKSFWVDVDVSRVGDGKTRSIYADRPAALAWILTFQRDTGLPPPNLWVDSGYGYHLYWVLEDAMTRAEWQPYADALVAALQQHKFLCELGITSDAARILRVPNTLNLKGGGQAPVRVMDRQSRGDYPNQLILDKLKPYLGMRSTTVVQQPTALLTGSMPAAFAGSSALNMAAAGQLNVPQHAPVLHEFAEVAKHCEQVKLSLAANGAGDHYQLWYLGYLSMAHHCLDGQHFAHEISKGDPRYSAQATDAARARIAQEKARKQSGPPRCTSFDSWRPGVCPKCPFYGKIASPWSVGIPTGDLPFGYERDTAGGKIMRRVVDAAGNAQPVHMLTGDVYRPIVDQRRNNQGGYTFNFIYEFAGRKHSVYVEEPDLPTDAGALCSYLTGQSVLANDSNARELRRFIVSWMQTLRSQHLVREEQIDPFGYSTNDQGELTGFAVGGTLYRPDGSNELAPGGDANVVSRYQPRGRITPWTAAFNAVCAGRLDLQTIVAAAFAAPLLRFTGHAGVVLSMWSAGGGAGKSSAMKVGTAAWASQNSIIATDPTENAMIEILSQTKAMALHWDEMSVGKGHLDIVKALMKISIGTSKERMGADLKLVGTKTWQTIVVMCANKPVLQELYQSSGYSDATMLRCFEIEIRKPAMPNASQVARTVDELQSHYGHVGRQFAAFLAANLDTVKTQVAAMQDHLETTLKADSAERLYIALMSILIVAARYVTLLGLATFDVAGLKQYLIDTFHTLRSARTKDSIIKDGRYNIHELLGQFCNTYSSHRIVTSHFARPGRGSAPKVEIPLVVGRTLEIHMSRADRMIRINKDTFLKWGKQRGIAPAVAIQNMIEEWGVVDDTRTLGAGTEWAARMRALDVPLFHLDASGSEVNHGIDALIPDVPTPGGQQQGPALNARQGTP